MKLNNLEKSPGSVHAKKRVGRGNASGNGTTAGRGMNGQKSRSGSKTRSYFEGGQMPLSRRIPKRGFCNIFKKEYAIINLEKLNRFNDDEVINPERFLEEGMIKKIGDGIKILGGGAINKKITVRAHRFSQEAIKKIESAGGKVEVI
ncbi:MAG: 50S ribosomal protein L15 [Candidatus Caldatribacteriota bacterium]|jgi:large subunit ribosomal protein L15|nr:50S ribosomal protein L15 [Atribacterota bacterium]MDD3030913.1 50S ribosomal protein L15 [Atribacterota bacterium]MDD4288485.1 50S ribosomal protein L15 [Atribacterota bacterium]MDD4764318.1 50S ribosomal protein L15 [Atribacterota bacterium]MDD5635700.1 50S ribosomal protein L15 [Atribacterota bacterium]